MPLPGQRIMAWGFINFAIGHKIILCKAKMKIRLDFSFTDQNYDTTSMFLFCL